MFGSLVPEEKLYHTGYPSGREAALEDEAGPSIPGGGAFATGGSVFAILTAGSLEDEAGADDFCGGARGDALPSMKAGGGLYGKPEVDRFGSAASAGSGGGSGFAEGGVPAGSASEMPEDLALGKFLPKSSSWLEVPEASWERSLCPDPLLEVSKIAPPYHYNEL